MTENGNKFTFAAFMEVFLYGFKSIRYAGTLVAVGGPFSVLVNVVWVDNFDLF